LATAPHRSATRLALGLVRGVLRALAYGLVGGLAVLLVLGVRFLDARPDLQVWQLADLDAEFTAESPVESFAAYLELEDRLFEQVETLVEAKLRPEDRTELNRFHRGSRSDPGRWPRDWNRSFELAADRPRAGVLLLHGMSDSPYSLRDLGRALHERGAHVVGLRLPGHGTAPSGLVSVRWQDMAAATELALRHLHERTGGAPIYVIGYSNGGALAVRHAIAALEDSSVPPVDGLVLISPSIGVTPLAAFAVWQARLGVLLGLPKLAWSAILPEYDPFKYNSFAVNAGDQVFRLTAVIGAGLGRLREAGRLDDFPPVLAFQSLTDATVSTRAVIDGLFLRLPEGGHELVLFDLNRWAAAEDLLASDPKGPIKADLAGALLPFDLSFITNETETSERLVLRHKDAGSTAIEEEPLDLTWPRGLFSLSHIALPFPETDPLYGGPDAPPSPGIQLGRAELRGERGVLLVSGTDLMRLRWNPFYSLLKEQVIAALGLAER
jgi:alpha-beta hydrolase superfamily lysophospholipase